MTIPFELPLFVSAAVVADGAPGARLPVSLDALAIAAVLVLVLLGIAAALLSLRDVIRLARHKEGAPVVSRRLALRLTAFGVLVYSLIRARDAIADPVNAPGMVLAIAWCFLAYAAVRLFDILLRNARAAAIAGLLLADAGLAAATVFLTRDFGYVPRMIALAAAGLTLHVGMLIRADVRRVLGTRALAGFTLALIVLLAGPVLEHRSTLLAPMLDRPGRAQILPAARGPMRAVFVANEANHVLFIRDDDPSAVHALDLADGQVTSFANPAEDFVAVRSGFDDKTVLAVSQSPQGGSVYLLQLPYMNVQARYAYTRDRFGRVVGPPAFDARYMGSDLVAAVVKDERAHLALCAGPRDGSRPVSDAGGTCRDTPFDAGDVGELFTIENEGLAFVVDPGRWRKAGGRIFQFGAARLMERKVFEAARPITGALLSPDNVVLYVAFGFDKRITYFVPRDLAPQYNVETLIHPTALAISPDGTLLYVGSWFDGEVQILRIRDGLFTRPMYAGAGLRELSLDAKNNVLYAATRLGVVRIDLSVIPIPTGAVRIGGDVDE
ncbi:hypothetical protein K8I61_12470 [bacterium]|nr:hypothetical protein [bacterium]